MAGDIEKVQTTITAQIDDASLLRVRQELREALQKTLGTVKVAIPGATPTTTAEAEILQGGKRFGVKARLTEKMVGRGEEKQLVEEFSTSIAELRNKRDKLWEADLKKWVKLRKEEFERTIVSDSGLISSGKKASAEIRGEREKLHSSIRKQFDKDVKEWQRLSREEFQATIIPESSLISSGKKANEGVKNDRKAAADKRLKERQRQAAVEKGYQADLAAGMAAVNAQEKANAKTTRDKEVKANREANKKRMAEQERAANFRNAMLVGASGAIGIFGTAGFVALNVGFAAMSGDVMGAAVAGVTTAIGETWRALNRLSDASKASARSLNFVSRGLKEAEAQMEAFKAFTGAGGLSSERAGIERRLELLRDKGPGLGSWNRVFNDFTQATKTTLSRSVTGGAGAGPGVTFTSELVRQAINSARGVMPDLETSRRNMLMQMSGGSPGVGNDPFQEWLRIQNAALDMSKGEEVRLQQKQIEMLDLLIKRLKGGDIADPTFKGGFMWGLKQGIPGF